MRNVIKIIGCLCNLMFFAFILNCNVINSAQADVCFLPEGEGCNQVPYNEGCEGGKCAEPTPAPDPNETCNASSYCYATEEEAKNARGATFTNTSHVRYISQTLDSYKHEGNCYCLKNSCGFSSSRSLTANIVNLGYYLSESKGEGWTCSKCQDEHSILHNNYKCTEKQCTSPATISCVAEDECHKCVPTGAYSGDNVCEELQAVEPSCPQGYSETVPSSLCYDTINMTCGKEGDKCYQTIDEPNCGANKRVSSDNGVCSCTCADGYHSDGDECVPITCPGSQTFDTASGTCKCPANAPYNSEAQCLLSARLDAYNLPNWWQMFQQKIGSAAYDVVQCMTPIKTAQAQTAVDLDDRPWGSLCTDNTPTFSCEDCLEYFECESVESKDFSGASNCNGKETFWQYTLTREKCNQICGYNIKNKLACSLEGIADSAKCVSDDGGYCWKKVTGDEINYCTADIYACMYDSNKDTFINISQKCLSSETSVDGLYFMTFTYSCENILEGESTVHNTVQTGLCDDTCSGGISTELVSMCKDKPSSWTAEIYEHIYDGNGGDNPKYIASVSSPDGSTKTVTLPGSNAKLTIAADRSCGQNEDSDDGHQRYLCGDPLKIDLMNASTQAFSEYLGFSANVHSSTDGLLMFFNGMTPSVALGRSDVESDEDAWRVLYSATIQNGDNVYITPHNRYCFADDGYYYGICHSDGCDAATEFEENASTYTYAWLGTLDRNCSGTHTIGQVTIPGIGRVCIENAELYGKGIDPRVP